MSARKHDNVEARLIDLVGRKALKKANKLIKKGELLSCHATPDGTLKALFKDSKTDAYERVSTDFLSESKTSVSGKTKLSDHQIAALLSHSMRVIRKQPAPSEHSAPYQGLKFKPLIETVETAIAPPQATVHIKTTYSFPHVPSKWERFSILLTLQLGPKSYTGNLGNIRQLYFDKSFVATLKLSHFSLQDRQIIRYLAVNAESEGRALTLDAEQTAEFFHCLPNFDRFELNDERINVHTEVAEPVLVRESRGGRRFLRPALAVGEALLPLRAVKVIVGRSGCWVGMNGEYWWIPGTADVTWIRSLLRSEEQECSHERDHALIANQDHCPVRIVDDAPKSLRKVKCAALLDMVRCDDGRFLLNLSFNYEADIYLPDNLRLVRAHGHFWKRDDELEQSLTNEILGFGFERLRKSPGKFVIKDPEAAATFLDEGLAAWRGRRGEIYLSERLAAKRGGEKVEPLSLRCEVVAEKGDVFHIQCRPRTPGVDVSWIDLFDLAANNGRYLPTGEGFLRVPVDLAAFVNAVSDVVSVSGDAPDVLRISRTDAPFWVEAAGDLVDLVPNRLRTLRDQLDVDGETNRDDEAAARTQRPAPFHGELRHYQVVGLNWLKRLANLGFNGVLADEMGLGKTVQALALLNESVNGSAERRPPSLVICPTSLVENWTREARRFTPKLDVLPIKGKSRKPLWERAADLDLVICSYALARRDAAVLKTARFHFLILDEAQHIKNPGTANAKTCKAIRASHRLVLTGTPLENRTEDVWSIFDFLHPGMLGPFRTFQKEYGGNKVDKRRQTLLAMRISPFLLRRRKKDVCAELPPKYTQELYCEMDVPQRTLYESLLKRGRDQLKDMVARDDGKMKFQLLATLTRLRQICCHPELIPADMRNGSVESAKTELLREVLSEALDAGHKALVFSQFTSLLKILREWLDEREIPYEYLDGSTTNRMKRVDRFNEDKSIPLFLLSLKAGGVGLNLTSADTVILYDPWWNPAVEDQAADRTHRIGQKNPVHCMKLVVRDSIEERVLNLQRRKQSLFNNLVDNPAASMDNVSLDDLKFILEG